MTFDMTPDRERDPDAWVGGVRRKPTWERRPGLLDRAGVHALLRAAQLPRAELHHMGADDAMLARTGAHIEESSAALLLGRIAWDAEFGDAGLSWGATARQRKEAQRMGLAIVKAHFG